MDLVVYLIVGMGGLLLGWLIARAASQKKSRQLLQEKDQAYLKLDKEFSTLQSVSQTRLSMAREQLDLERKQHEHTREHLRTNQEAAAALRGELEAARERLSSQKEEINQLRETFQKEFSLVANKLLEENAQKFSLHSKENLSRLLEPLDKNLQSFRAKVEEVYEKEAQQRFSLGERVKELTELNQQVSKEARNLTEALKSETKTQGRWGEMILESILEKSGLERGREYFMEHELRDDLGQHMLSAKGKKMRPDAVIKYPDNRSVIIDAKVSLTAFVRSVEAQEAETSKAELKNHLISIKQHINNLSTKGYDAYDPALDFVMLFIPSEAAYIAAVKEDPDLWSYAYDRRILLLSPTNLITSLKLIVDLWKREYQNLNAKEIAAQGGKLYDKFVGFVTNMEDVGKRLNQAQESFDKAQRQLISGNGNLVGQAQKLKDLGVTSRKEVPSHLLSPMEEPS